MAGKKIITVFGATGAQGGGVVDTFVSDPKLKAEWTVRGVTRDVNKASSKALAAKGVEVVSANLDDKASLVKVMTGADVVFAVTNYWEKINKDYEVQQGKNLADAAKEAGVGLFIWSSLVDATKVSKGKLTKVYHFDSKAEVEEYVRSLGIPASFFLAGFYMSNIDGGSLSRFPPENVWTLALPAEGGALLPLLDVRDTGKYVKAMALQKEKVLGRRVYGAAEYLSLDQVLDVFRKTFPGDAGDARLFTVPQEMFLSMFAGGNVPAFMGYHPEGLPDFVGEEMLQNFLLAKEGGYYGGEGLEWSRELVEAVGEKLTTWDEYVKKAEAFKDLK